MPLYRAELLAKKPLRYAALIHDVSQVLYLPFDWDDGSYARDRSGHGFHGTIHGAARVGGKIGMALSFDGIDDKVDCGSVAALRPSQFTLLVWAKWFEKPSVLGYYPTVASRVEATRGYGILSEPSVDRIRFQVADGTTWYQIDTPYSITLNRWYYLGLTFDGSIMKGYVDLSLIGSISAAIAYLAGTHFQVGASYGYGNYFKGVIDEPRFFNRVLSLAEMRMLMYRRI